MCIRDRSWLLAFICFFYLCWREYSCMLFR